MDIVGPLPTTSTYIITLTDYYTEWVKAAPLQDKSTLSVANLLFTIRKWIKEENLSTESQSLPSVYL